MESAMKYQMKLSFAAAALLAAVMGSATAAQAQNGPWCAHYDFGSDESLNCGFYSFRQCVADVRGVGGFCSQNSTYGLAPRSRWHPSYR
jgi:hypothetical protein